MVDRPITTGEWRAYELMGEVPANVEQIIYGAALVGEGRAWVDGVSIEAVDQSASQGAVPSLTHCAP